MQRPREIGVFVCPPCPTHGRLSPASNGRLWNLIGFEDLRTLCLEVRDHGWRGRAIAYTRDAERDPPRPAGEARLRSLKASQWGPSTLADGQMGYSWSAMS